VVEELQFTPMSRLSDFVLFDLKLLFLQLFDFIGFDISVLSAFEGFLADFVVAVDNFPFFLLRVVHFVPTFGLLFHFDPSLQFLFALFEFLYFSVFVLFHHPRSADCQQIFTHQKSMPYGNGKFTAIQVKCIWGSKMLANSN
jgi:hypothetical protein